ncbi:MAG: hypothetical protein HY052_09755 [Proteobacteria bacterium]|nr:hypothetical protein [Pseudomonadota bacterium]
MPEDPQRPKKKRFSLRQEFNDIFKGLQWKDLKGIGEDTLRDLKKPAEWLVLAAGIAVPGGFIAYAIYRVRHYRKGLKPANDNKNPKTPRPPENKPPQP